MFQKQFQFSALVNNKCSIVIQLDILTISPSILCKGLGYPHFVTLKQPFAHDRNFGKTEQFQHLALAFLGWLGYLTQAMIDQWFPQAAIDQS